MNSKKKIKVLLIHDHVIVREGLYELFINQPDIEVVGEEVNVENIIQVTEMLKPDVVVVNISMSEVNTTELTRQILNRNPKIRFVALITHPHIHLIEQAIKVGISGFVSLNCSFNELAHAVRAVYKKRRYSVLIQTSF